MLSSLVDGADIGVVQRRAGAGFASKPFGYLGIAGKFIGQEFERNEPAGFEVSALYTIPVPPPPSLSTMG